MKSKKNLCEVSLLLLLCFMLSVLSSCTLTSNVNDPNKQTDNEKSTEQTTDESSQSPDESSPQQIDAEEIIEIYQIAYKISKLFANEETTESFEAWHASLTLSECENAYATATILGFDGTLTEWCNALIGENVIKVEKAAAAENEETYSILFADNTTIQFIGSYAIPDTPDHFPMLTYLYNTSPDHMAIAKYIQSALASHDITLKLENRDWGTFYDARKKGDYTIARNGWVSDYSDPISFLDLWTSYSVGNDIQFGKGAHATLKMYDLDLTKWGYDVKVEDGTWAQTYDVLISTIKSCSDNNKRYEMMHLAEDMLMATGCITPLYYYTDLYMIDDSVKGFYSTPLGYKHFMYSTVDGANSINVGLSSEPDSLDPALNYTVDGATMINHLFSGLAKWTQDDNGKLIIAPDCAEALPEGTWNADGTVTYTYTLKEGLKWSDGTELKASDFVYAWNRAASEELFADYGYMFELIVGYEDVAYGVAGAKLAAVADDDARTITVTITDAVPYWNELLAFPTYFPVRADVVENANWATGANTCIGNGPYKIDSWAHNSKIVLKKNPNYHEADKVTMNKIEFHLSADPEDMLTNFKNGTWQFIEEVPTTEIPTLKKNYKDEFVIAGQMGTYYICWNINKRILPANSTLVGVEAERAQAEIRKAIGLLLDRNYIVEKITQGGEVPASSLIPMGMTNPDGTEFYKTANSTTDNFDGYYDVSPQAYNLNIYLARSILNKYYN